jgi:D-cysteine desulfhydrase
VSAQRHLSALVPGLDGVIRPLDLVDRPTPISAEPNLAQRWKLKHLWIKRDDLTSSVYGGSKVRNLEFFFGKARAEGAKTVATMGPLGSHQALAMAVHGALAGFKTRALLVPQTPVREVDLNKHLLPALGTTVFRSEHYYQVPFNFIRTRWGGDRTFWIPPGSKHPVGVLGVIEGALEVIESIRVGEIPCPDDIVVPTGTCATASGIFLALAMARLPVRVVAVRLVPALITGPAKMHALAEKTLALLRRAGYRDEVKWGDVLWIDDLAAPGYGLSNPPAEAAIHDVADLGHFRTELTYTGKCLGLFEMDVLAGRSVLFWNTYSAVDPDPVGVKAMVRQ